jgi:RimJ/RimL family protein N-acetyltransferase
MAQQKLDLQYRLATLDDLQFITDVETDPENEPFIGQDTLDMHQAFLKNPDYRYWIGEIQIDDENNPNYPSGSKKCIGYAIVKGCTNPHLSLELYRIALSERDQGYGYPFLKFIQNFAFNELYFHRLWLDVLNTNSRVIKVYEKVGFVKEGCLRECYLAPTGMFETLHLYSILSHEFQNNQHL